MITYLYWAAIMALALGALWAGAVSIGKPLGDLVRDIARYQQEMFAVKTDRQHACSKLTLFLLGHVNLFDFVTGRVGKIEADVTLWAGTAVVQHLPGLGTHGLLALGLHALQIQLPVPLDFLGTLLRQPGLGLINRRSALSLLGLPVLFTLFLLGGFYFLLIDQTRLQ